MIQKSVLQIKQYKQHCSSGDFRIFEEYFPKMKQGEANKIKQILSSGTENESSGINVELMAD